MLELRTRLRRLLHRPAYIFSVVLSLGLGTAVSVAAFSFTNALVFRSLPGITDRKDLIRIDWASASTALTTSEFRAIESQQIRSFSTIAAQGVTPLPIVLPSGAETLSVAFVSRRLFETLGTGVVLGRVLTAADGESSAAPVALISERLWRRAFNGRGVLETPLTIAGRSFSIVGVTPDRVSGTHIIDLGARDTDSPDAWIFRATPRSGPRPPGSGSMAFRSRPVDARADVRAVQSGSIFRDADHERSARCRRAAQIFRVYGGGIDWRDEPAQALLTGALVLFIAVIVLVMGCVNVIDVNLTRALDESSELSLRLALGASRWRIVRPLLLEVAGLALLSTLLGLAGARMLLLRAGGVSPVPLAVDPVAMAFAALLVTAVVCVTGLLPAWWSSHDVVAAGLRELRGTSVAHALRPLIVVGCVGPCSR